MAQVSFIIIHSTGLAPFPRLSAPPHSSHSILKKYNLLSWDNLIKYVHTCLLFKTMNSFISPLKQFVNIRTAHRSTRGGERGDCVIPFKRSNFSQSVFSVKAARQWNSIPSTIRRLHTFGSFQSHLKKWLLTTQQCQH